MINIDDLTIGQARELAAMFAGAHAAPPTVIDHGLQIAVLDRGFVYIGYVTTDGEWCRIENAWNIRRWGTKKGLGELVNGPLSDTVLDRVGRIRLPMSALLHLIEAKGTAWTSKLN